MTSVYPALISRSNRSALMSTVRSRRICSAMAPVPSFDPNKFIPSIKAKDGQALQKDEGDPLVNRAISCLPLGSTFKIVTALAGLRKGLANKSFNCSGGVSYGDHYFKCWV